VTNLANAKKGEAFCAISVDLVSKYEIAHVTTPLTNEFNTGNRRKTDKRKKNIEKTPRKRGKVKLFSPLVFKLQTKNILNHLK
jgi:hypothetical protein